VVVSKPAFMTISCFKTTWFVFVVLLSNMFERIRFGWKIVVAILVRHFSRSNLMIISLKRSYSTDDGLAVAAKHL